MNKTTIGVIVVGLIVIVAGVAALIYSEKAAQAPGELDQFAQCLADEGATFYGAFWCPHCQNQKKLFGNSARLLPYVECSTPNGQSQLPVCTQAGVEQYPTWIFADGTKQTGELDLATLSEKTGCMLPGDAAASAPEEGVSSPAAE